MADESPLQHPAPAELSSGSGQSAAPVRSAAGLRLSAGGGGQSIKRHLCGSGVVLGLNAARWLRRRLACCGHIRTGAWVCRSLRSRSHKIAEDTDIERDHIVDTVMAANPLITVEVIRNFSTGYHSRNGGGDLIQTDGDLPIIDLTRVDAPGLQTPEPTDSRDKRPAQTTFGASVGLLRGSIYLGLALTLFVPLGRRPGDLSSRRLTYRRPTSASRRFSSRCCWLSRQPWTSGLDWLCWPVATGLACC